MCILAVFITAVLLWEELKSNVEALEDKQSVKDISTDLDQWWGQYDHVCLLIDQINRGFGFVLLVFVSHSFVFLIQQFPFVFSAFHDRSIWKEVEDFPEVFTNNVCILFHEFLRFFAVVVTSNRIKVQVRQFNMYNAF